jgi:hypothetical protein
MACAAPSKLAKIRYALGLLHKAGLHARCAGLVGQANQGAVTHPGAAEWPWFTQYETLRPQTEGSGVLLRANETE